jgi:hypothetical protein
MFRPFAILVRAACKRNYIQFVEWYWQRKNSSARKKKTCASTTLWTSNFTCTGLRQNPCLRRKRHTIKRMARPKRKTILNHIQRFSSYCTVNTLRLIETRFGVFKVVLSSGVVDCDSLFLWLDFRVSGESADSSDSHQRLNYYTVPTHWQQPTRNTVSQPTRITTW